MRALLVLAVLAVALCGCGGDVGVPAEDAAASDRVTHRSAEWGYTVSFPGTWRRAEQPVVPLADPREILAVGTFALRHRRTNCNAFAGSAREDMGPADAFLSVMERGHDGSSRWPDFPPRPARFEPTADTASRGEPACGDRPGTEVHWLNFADAGRRFHVLMVAGPAAPAAVRDEAWRILDGLRLDPDAEPDWPAAP